MIEDAPLPVLPPLAVQILRGVPAAVIEWPLQRVTGAFAQRHRGVFERLGPHASRSFLIDPLDLPFAFRLNPRRPVPVIETLRRPVVCRCDARIAGPLSALLGMVHGTLDGDALFFSRDLLIEGDIEAVLALRNALDDAELDLLAESAVAFGPIGRRLAPLVRLAALEASRLTGVALTRPEPCA